MCLSAMRIAVLFICLQDDLPATRSHINCNGFKPNACVYCVSMTVWFPELQVSCKQVSMTGAGTSSLPQLCYLEGRTLPEDYLFDDEPPSTPSALADIAIRAQSAQAARHNMVPRYSQTDIRVAKATLSGMFDNLQGMLMRQELFRCLVLQQLTSVSFCWLLIGEQQARIPHACTICNQRQAVCRATSLSQAGKLHAPELLELSSK